MKNSNFDNSDPGKKKRSFTKFSGVLFFITLVGIIGVAMVLDTQKSAGRPHFQSPVTEPVTRPLMAPAAALKGKNSSMPDLPELTKRLAQRLLKQPGDLAGWRLLIRSYVTLGEMVQAQATYETATAKAPKDVELRVVYGEALMKKTQDIITPEVRQLFMEAHEIDNKHPGARHYLALANYQEGKTQQAYDAWNRLASEANPDAPWLPQVKSYLVKAAKQLGRNPAVLQKPAPQK